MTGKDPVKINLGEKFARFHDHWSPKIIAALNGQVVKLVKFRGEFVWHAHEDAEELFLVHRGAFRLELRDRVIELEEGDLVVMPEWI